MLVAKEAYAVQVSAMGERRAGKRELKKIRKRRRKKAEAQVSVEQVEQQADKEGQDEVKRPRMEVDHEQARQNRIKRNKVKTSRLRQLRKENYERMRRRADTQLRTNAAEYLWAKYRIWAKEKLSEVEATAEKWTKDHVISSDDAPGETILEVVRGVAGVDYSKCDEWSKESLPAVAAIVLASSGLRAAHLGPTLYDGGAVAKLFSKHCKVHEQAHWLKSYSKYGVIRSAVGTAKRVHQLCDEGHLTLDYTKVIVIDCKRAETTKNILDMPQPTDELFSFIHHYARPLINQGKLRIIVHLPPEENKTETPETPGS